MEDRRSLLRRLLRYTVLAAIAAMLLSVAQVLMLRWVDPWSSAFMMDARIDSWFNDDKQPFRLRQKWRDYGQISRELALAVVASEDQRFPDHHGFDFAQI